MGPPHAARLLDHDAIQARTVAFCVLRLRSVVAFLTGFSLLSCDLLLPSQSAASFSTYALALVPCSWWNHRWRAFSPYARTRCADADRAHVLFSTSVWWSPDISRAEHFRFTSRCLLILTFIVAFPRHRVRVPDFSMWMARSVRFARGGGSCALYDFRSVRLGARLLGRVAQQRCRRPRVRGVVVRCGRRIQGDGSTGRVPVASRSCRVEVADSGDAITSGRFRWRFRHATAVVERAHRCGRAMRSVRARLRALISCSTLFSARAASMRICSVIWKTSSRSFRWSSSATVVASWRRRRRTVEHVRSPASSGDLVRGRPPVTGHRKLVWVFASRTCWRAWCWFCSLPVPHRC